MFHDAYDVMTKTSDNNKLDESEEVYEYLLCAICPVTLTKPGLGYREDENRIGPRIRDWVVGVPDTGFVFPAFTDRSSDIHSVMFYTRDTKTPHAEFMESGLGCGTELTATEKKLTFQSIVKEVIGEDEEESDAVFGDIQENLNNMIPVTEDETVEPDPVIVTRSAIADVLAESGVTEEQAAVIENTYENVFGEELPEAGQLVDPKLVEPAGAKKAGAGKAGGKLKAAARGDALRSGLGGRCRWRRCPCRQDLRCHPARQAGKSRTDSLPGHRRAEMSGHSDG